MVYRTGELARWCRIAYVVYRTGELTRCRIAYVVCRTGVLARWCRIAYVVYRTGESARIVPVRWLIDVGLRV